MGDLQPLEEMKSVAVGAHDGHLLSLIFSAAFGILISWGKILLDVFKITGKELCRLMAVLLLV